MNEPLVSVVCLSFNHEKYIEESIGSVLHQTYKNIQIIAIDDASSDNSQQVLRDLAQRHPQIQLILLHENIGNCRAFNKSLPFIQGEFVIDFATDDVMMPDRIEQQVNKFFTLDETYGVVFTDSIYIDHKGDFIEQHSEMLVKRGLEGEIPEGDVYQQILSRYFMSSPTVMVRTKVLKELNGYDESLSYEDFDFWVRSSRNYKYAYLNKPLTKVRKLKKSMSTELYKRGDKQLRSTYEICLKAMKLNQSNGDWNALKIRVGYELFHAVFSGNHYEAELFYDLLKKIGGVSLKSKWLNLLNNLRLPLYPLRKIYQRFRYGPYA